METGIKVCDAMTEQPVTIGPNATLKQCAELMKKERVGALLVKDKEKLVGIITEQDIVIKAVSADLKASVVRAKDVMEANLITISPEKDIFDAIKMMRDYDVRHLPVLDRGKFLGLVTDKDVLKIEPDLFDILVEKLDIREAERKPI